jgi:hypothetical protein
MQLATVPGLVFSLGMRNAETVQKTFKLSWLRLVLLVVTQPLYIGYEMVRLHFLVIIL